VLNVVGGGYALMASDGHMQLADKIIEEAAKKGEKIAVLFLQYSKFSMDCNQRSHGNPDPAPQAAYPAQLRQAVALMDYLLTDMNKSYSQVLSFDMTTKLLLKIK